VLYTNHLPKVGANDPGTWRRLIVIPFNAKIQGGRDVKNYTEHLFQNAGGAVLKWIIEGAKKVIAMDFRIDPPKCVREAMEAYRENNDWLNQFLTECCETGANFTEKSGELYSAYRAYCAGTGDYTRSTTDFYTAIENAGYNRRRNSKGRFVDGLRLKITSFSEANGDFPDFLN
jgi:phage/plasmid-associated DNA primase